MKLIEFTPDWTTVAAPNREAASTSPGSSRVPIIIAEDDVVSQTVLATVLRNAGYSPVLTANGSDAMTALRLQQKLCVAIIDWGMPEMDGAEVCRRIRASGKLVHVIMLTARERKEDAIEALDSGADDYLVKPFDAGELLARVRAGMRTLEVQAVLADRAESLATGRLRAPQHTMVLPL